jgi:hypothetical protein
MLETFINEELKFQEQMRTPGKNDTKLKLKKKNTKLEEPTKTLIPSIFQRRAESMRLDSKEDQGVSEEEKRLYKYHSKSFQI